MSPGSKEPPRPPGPSTPYTGGAMLYLDHAATTIVRPQVRDAMAPFLEGDFGNPAGLHEMSRRAKNAVEDARERAAELIGAARPLEIVFTGSGTEADNLAVAGAALAAASGAGVVVSAVEHHAVLEAAEFVHRLGHPIDIVPVDAVGRVDPADVADRVLPGTAVVSVMTANNETGLVQPVKKIAEAVRGGDPAVLVHTDAVQAFVSRPVTVDSTGADMISLAAHKYGGPKGVGLLYVRDGIELEPVVHGGGQELGRRSGTLNVAGIVGMAAAMDAAAADRERFEEEVGSVRDAFEERLVERLPDLVISASGEDRLVQHSHVRIPGVSAETLLIRLDQVGVAASAGSACQSGAVEASHVLQAMGVEETAAGEFVRFSFGWTTAPGDGPRAADIVAQVAKDLR